MKEACTKPAQQDDAVSRRDTSKGLRHPKVCLPQSMGSWRLRHIQRMIAQDRDRDRDHVMIADE